MTGEKRFFRITLLFCLVVLFAFSGLTASPAPVAEGWLPDGYVAATSGGSDWYFSRNFLDIPSLKATVDGWKASDSARLDAADPVVIAVIDSGIIAGHELFDGVLLRDADGRIIGRNTLNEVSTDNLTDNVVNYHGTHVAGIVAVLIRALGLEDYIKIMPIKAGYPDPAAGNNASFDLEPVRRAVTFALNNGADVVNMSFATDRNSWASVVREEDAERAVFVAAAGNQGSEINRYPAASEYVLGVMNYSDNNGSPGLHSSSNYNSNYAFAAPGTAIVSADGAVANGYKEMRGTSMASPIAAFAAALVTLKYRSIEESSGIEMSAPLAKTMLELNAEDSAKLSKGGYSLPLLDINKLVTTEFLYDSRYEDKIYVMPECVSIETSDENTMLSSGDTVTVSAKIYPSNSRKDLICTWTLVDGDSTVPLGTGRELTFVPPNRLGPFEVRLLVATQDGAISLNADKTLSVVYFLPDDKNSALISDGKILTVPGEGVPSYTIALAEELTLSVKGMEYAAPDTYVKWYVNGELVSTCNDFTFFRVREGRYEITAKVGDKIIGGKSIVVFVDESLPFDFTKVYTPLEIFTLTALSALIFALFVTLIVIVVRKRRQLF